jgi:hypothetical protein
LLKPTLYYSKENVMKNYETPEIVLASVAPQDVLTSSVGLFATRGSDIENTIEWGKI